MPAPIYFAEGPGLSGPARIRVPLVTSDATIISEALAETGEAVTEVGLAIRRGAEETRAAQATTEYLTELDALESRFSQDPDFQHAPKTFRAERLRLEGEILGRGGFSAAKRADLELTFRRTGLSSQGRVDGSALTRNSQAAEAALDDQEGLWYRRYREANTDIDRQTVLAEWDRSIDNQQRAGTVSIASAATRRERRGATLDEADAIALIRERPDSAAAALRDPARFENLKPDARERLITAAETQGDELATAELANRALFKPELASLEVGRVVNPTHVETIFDQAVIPQESGGRANAKSPKGALGVAQLLPGTARAMAKKLGVGHIAGLDDKSLEAELLKNPMLNRRLGLAYFAEQLIAFDGSLPLALAAYNAGPKEAKRWRDEAVRQFGPSPSPAQILSVVDFKETRNYVTEIYGRMGARLDTGLSPAGVFKAANKVGEAIAGEERRRDQMIKDIAAIGRSGNELADMIKARVGVDPDQVAAFRQQQAAAAARGSIEAANAVRAIDEALAAKPFIDQAWSTPPADIDAAIAVLEAQLANQGTATGAEFRQLKAFSAVRDEIRSKAAENPVGLGERAGLYRGVAIDPEGDFAAGAMREALGWRDLHATAARATYGSPLLPFKPDEVAALKVRWGDGSLQDRLTMLAGMASAMRPAVYEAAVGQIAGDDPHSLTAGLFARERPELARKILRGAELMAVEGVRKTVSEEIRPALVDTLGGDVWPPGSRALQNVVDAALAVYVAERGGNRELFSAGDRDGFEAAIEEVAGEIVDINGVRVPAPPGLAGWEFERLVDNLEAGDLPAGAFARDGAPIAPEEVGRSGVFKQLAPGSTRYAVGLFAAGAADGLQPLVDGNGTPLVIDTRALAERRGGRAFSRGGFLPFVWTPGLSSGITLTRPPPPEPAEPSEIFPPEIFDFGGRGR